MQPLFIKPIFKERIWGGKSLEDFGYELPTHNIGECWAVSAHPSGMGVIENGKFAGKTLGEIWDSERWLFGDIQGSSFPLLTKLLDVEHDLSVQVHPDDDYAYSKENGAFGKTECWYVVDCKENAEIILGHNTQTKEEFVSMIKANRWNKLLKKVPIKKGDFFYVESGTVHALCAGAMILETQQNSDTTYRLYDYDRRDESGHTRPLHIQQSLDVVKIPHKPSVTKTKKEIKDSYVKTTFLKERYFSVYKYEINKRTKLIFDSQAFHIVSVISGEGSITANNEKYRLMKGRHFILPHQINDIVVEGSMEWIVSHP